MGTESVRVVPPSVQSPILPRRNTDYGRSLQFVLDREGIQSQDKDDPGGHTVFGVARKFWPHWEGWKIVDAINLKHRSKADRDRALEESIPLKRMVRVFYYDNFWLANSCDKLPFQVALPLFDFALNSRAKVARQAFQRAVGADPDGVIGPATIRRLSTKLKRTSALSIGMAVTDARLMRYVRRVQQGKSPAKYLGGWMRRIVAVSHTVAAHNGQK